jgi:uncharacterized protein YbaR (Trm112 family)
MISEQLLELLACPACHESLVVTSEQSGLLCVRCRLVYPVRDGIPVMLQEEAQPAAGDHGQ